MKQDVASDEDTELTATAFFYPPQHSPELHIRCVQTRTGGSNGQEAYTPTLATSVSPINP